MDNPSPKISFIPKGSLVHEQSFLERPQSRSALGILAVALFSISALGYGGLYFFNNFLESKISARLGEIQKIQQVFNESPQVKRANDFRFRAELVRQLLDAHISVTPILNFLSDNTVKSIMYEKFAFVKDGGSLTVKIAGESPTYAALAYQKELFSKKTAELQSVAVSEVALTTFGTVAFNLKLEFKPEYLSYAKNVVVAVQPPAPTEASLPAEQATVNQGGQAAQAEAVAQSAPAPFWSRLWSSIKFW